jgi:hypothetical protein
MSLTAIFDDFNSSTHIVHPYTLIKNIFQSEERIEKTTNGDSLKSDVMLLRAEPSQIKEYKNNNYLLSNLKARINTLTVSERWIAEGVEKPNYVCKEEAYKVVQILYNSYKYHPERIGPSKEGGIFIYYVNYHNNKTLSIEVSNDLEIAALVNRNRVIIGALDIFNYDFSEINQVYAY